MNPLCGTWQLKTFCIERCATGARQAYFSERPSGLLVYEPGGYFSAQIAGSDRPSFASPDPYGGSESQQAACYRTYLAYFGRYEVDEAAGVVKHAVEGALYPVWLGSTQVRHFVLSESARLLTLSTPPIRVEGQDVVSRLEWLRLGAVLPVAQPSTL